jgi:betaine-aldehyde dehydrogenase
VIEKALTVFAGQFCMTGSRLLVQKSILDEVRTRLAKWLESVKAGPCGRSEKRRGADDQSTARPFDKTIAYIVRTNGLA